MTIKVATTIMIIMLCMVGDYAGNPVYDILMMVMTL